MQVILSHPYSGALHWWLQSGRDYAHTKQPGHSYYRHLYGDVDANLDMALACTVIFEHLIIPAADTYYPADASDANSRKIHIPTLEIQADWEPVHEAYRLSESIARDLAHDAEIANILRRVPAPVREDVVRDTLTDALLMREYHAPLISSAGRRRLILRIEELGAIPSPAPVAVPGHFPLNDGSVVTENIESYVTVTALMFNSPDIHSLSAIKDNDKIRRYAGKFQEVMTRTAADGDPRIEGLYEAIAEAWRSKAIADKVSHGFSTTSKGFSILGLIPVIGTAAEMVSMSTDAASLASERTSRNNSWYELAKEIKILETEAAMRTHLESLGLL